VFDSEEEPSTAWSRLVVIAPDDEAFRFARAVHRLGFATCRCTTEEGLVQIRVALEDANVKVIDAVLALASKARLASVTWGDPELLASAASGTGS
jgi:hypothetical protein